MFYELGYCVLDCCFYDCGILRFGVLICKSIMFLFIYGIDCGIDYYVLMWCEFYFDEFFGVKEELDWLEVGLNYYIVDL